MPIVGFFSTGDEFCSSGIFYKKFRLEYGIVFFLGTTNEGLIIIELYVRGKLSNRISRFLIPPSLKKDIELMKIILLIETKL